jgi:phosphoribosylformylglycinamidine synthase
MESHNHPSYIEPYHGAATGVGGILRDVFCMGARPVANLNCLRFGAKVHPRTPYLVEHVIKGIGDYGNCVGVPTIGGNISFDSSYDGNCLVNAFTAGLIHEDRIFKGYASGEGNLIVYVGSATGRDGIHGATMASDSFASSSGVSKSTVQVGDPFAEKLLLEATLECLEENLVVGLQDMGAAGLTSSAFEMAGRAGQGILMDLDSVPLRAVGMSAYDILLSESQERMLMVAEPEKWEKLATLLAKWELSYCVIGHVTSSGRVQIIAKNTLEVDVAVAPLTDSAPRYMRPQRPFVYSRDPDGLKNLLADEVQNHGLAATAIKLIGESGDKSAIFDQYDRKIGSRSVLSCDDGGAGVLWIHSDWEGGETNPNLGLVLSSACNERYCQSNPRLGASHAIAKAARMIAATGGVPLAATDCLNFGNPEDPGIMSQISDAIDGIAEACRALAVPVVSGNVSLYNQTDGASIFPTPMIGMVGRHDDVRQAVPAVARKGGAVGLLWPKQPQVSFGGSLLAKVLGQRPECAEPPCLDYTQELEAMEYLRKLVQKDLLGAARDVGAGGLVPCILRMVVSSGLGLDLSLAAIEGLSQLERWFAELGGAYVLCFRDPFCLKEAQALAGHLMHSDLKVLGDATGEDRRLVVDGQSIDLSSLKASSSGFITFS